jgi:hypothetical protein
LEQARPTVVIRSDLRAGLRGRADFRAYLALSAAPVVDHFQDAPEQVARHGDLGHLEYGELIS